MTSKEVASKNAISRPHAGSTDGAYKKALKGALAGGLAGGLDVLVSYPTEVVKTKMQLDVKNKKYMGTLDCIKKTIRRHGIPGLYRGMTVLLVGSIPKVASRFGAFEFFSYHFQEEDGTLSLTHSFISGLLAGVTEAVIAVTPMETIKTKIIKDMQRKQPQYHGFLHGVCKILKQEGIRGIYQGVSVTVLRQGTNQSIRFFMMFTQRDLYTGHDPNIAVPMHLVGLFGLFAGATSVLANIPLDVIKTRMQSMKSQKYKSALASVLVTLREEGPSAFFKGTAARVARVCLDVALTFMIYETVKEYIFDLWS